MANWRSSKEALISTLQKIESPDALDEGGRAQLASLLEAVNLKVQSPVAFMIDILHAPVRLVAVRVGIAMGIFDAFASKEFQPMSTKDLDSKTKGDEILLVRFLRILASYNMVEQMDPTMWKATPLGAMFANGSPPSLIVTHFHTQMKSSAKLLDYLTSTNFKNPTDYLQSPWQYALETDKGYFEWLETDELEQKAFNTAMSMIKQFRGQDWFEYYPADQLFSDMADRTILVDIGGSIGTDVLAFKKRHPNLPGKIVLQDLPKVINAISEPLSDGIEKQSYNAFEPQPVKNAKAYYMRNILHDWPDKQALQVLGNIRKAMAVDSVLLINDNVVAEDDVSRVVTGIDFTLMNDFGSMERTESQWKKLLHDGGFKKIEVHYPTEHAITPHALFVASPQ